MSQQPYQPTDPAAPGPDVPPPYGTPPEQVGGAPVYGTPPTVPQQPPEYGAQPPQYGQPAYGQPAQPGYGQPPPYGGQPPQYGQPVYGQPTQYEQPVYGQPTQYGQPVYGQATQYGQAPQYGQPGAPFGVDQFGRPYSDRSKIVAGILQLFFGVFGAGRWYTGHYGIAIAQLLTFGGFGIWALIDAVVLLVGDSKDAQGRPLRS